jgi:hypothetical protein
MYRQESILAIVVFPSQSNTIIPYVFGVLQAMRVLDIFSSAPGRLWWPIVSVVLTVRFPITWLGNVWEPAPSPLLQYGHGTAYLTPFLRFNPQIPLRCHMDLWLAHLVLTHPHLHQHQQQHLLQLQMLEPRVSVFSFFNHAAFFGVLPFPLPVLQFRDAFSSVSFSNMLWE